MYLWIVRLLTLIPSLSNSPRILSAPHVELLDAIERNQRAGLGGEALCGARSAPPAPQGPEAGAMRAKKRLGLDDAQRIPPRRRQGSERDQHDPVESGHPRPGDRPLQNGDLVAQLGDLREQRPSRPKQVDDSGGELVMTANMVR